MRTGGAAGEDGDGWRVRQHPAVTHGDPYRDAVNGKPKLRVLHLQAVGNMIPKDRVPMLLAR